MCCQRVEWLIIGAMGTFGLGHDVVDVAAFAEQLSEPGLAHALAVFRS